MRIEIYAKLLENESIVELHHILIVNFTCFCCSYCSWYSTW